jgi:hypothetical protein
VATVAGILAVNVTLHVDKVKKYGDVHVTILLRRMEVEIALCWERMLNIEFVEDSLVQVCLNVIFSSSP